MDLPSIETPQPKRRGRKPKAKAGPDAASPQRISEPVQGRSRFTVTLDLDLPPDYQPGNLPRAPIHVRGLTDDHALGVRVLIDGLSKQYGVEAVRHMLEIIGQQWRAKM